MARSVKGVILDVDGTLVDSNDAHAHAWVEALARGGFDARYEKVRRLIGMGSDNLLPEAVGLRKEDPKGKQLSEWWKQIFAEKYLPHIKAFPHTRELLQKMRDSGLKMVVASSAEEDILQKLLEIAGATEFIEDTTSSKDAKNSKPDPDIVQAALDSIGYEPNQVVMLGDTPYDVEAAQKAGAPIIGLRCGGWGDRELRGAIAVYADPADLLAHFDESPLGARGYAKDERS